MLQEIIKTGGGSFLIFGVVFALGFYAVRGVFGLHGRRSQHRKEFLELWADGRPRDALWLQVAVRHVFGSYLPTPVIRLALRQPDSSQSLSDLSELWDLLDYDSNTQTVRWRRARHSTAVERKRARCLRLAGYFICACGAALAAFISARSGPGTLGGWAYGFLAPVAGWLAVVCLMREEVFAVSVRAGDAWVNRINRAAKRPRKRPSGKHT